MRELYELTTLAFPLPHRKWRRPRATGSQCPMQPAPCNGSGIARCRVPIRSTLGRSNVGSKSASDTYAAIGGDWVAISQHLALWRRIGGDGGPRTTMMGNIASPWRYDATAFRARDPSNTRSPGLVLRPRAAVFRWDRRPW